MVTMAINIVNVIGGTPSVIDLLAGSAYLPDWIGDVKLTREP